MGVRTRADELLDEARSNLRKAANALSELVLEDDVWGWEDGYTEEFRVGVHDVFSELITLKKRLRG